MIFRPRSRQRRSSRAGIAALVLLLALGCGTTVINQIVEAQPDASNPGMDAGFIADASGGMDATVDTGLALASDGALDAPATSDAGDGCAGLACSVHACADGGATTIRGTLWDPAGKNPVYNALVSVVGLPAASARTDGAGAFTVRNAPDGVAFQLAAQLGKWQRQIPLSAVTPCGETVLDDGTFRLPKNASEGTMPSIAVSTGAADTMECVLSRMGIDASEFVGGGGSSGHVHVFAGGDNLLGASTSPPGPQSHQGLWDSPADLAAYDLILFSCEGSETSFLDDMGRQRLLDYVAGGGRVLASHFHYAWFTTGPFAGLAPGMATWTTGTNLVGDIYASVATLLPDGGPFPEGEAFSTWLGAVNALSGSPPELPIQLAHRNATLGAANTSSIPWLVEDGGAAPGTPQLFAYDAPVDGGAGGACHRVLYTDMHATGGPRQGANPDYADSGVVPGGCAAGPLSPREAALEFAVFDLAGCGGP